MKKIRFYWIIIFPLMISCHYIFPTTSKKPVKEKPVKEKPALAGTWKLMNYWGTDQAGKVYYPMGDSVIGQMQMDTSGRFSVQFMDAGRPLLSYGDPYYAPDNQIRIAFLGYTGYYGTYSVDTTRNLLVLHIIGASLPNWIGKKQVRGIRLKGDSLSLSEEATRINGIKMQQFSFWVREPE